MEDGNITATHGVIPQLLRSLIFEKKSGHVGLAAKTSAGIALEKYTITSPDSSSEILGDDGNGVIVNNLISLMFKNGAEVVTVVPVESESDYFTAFSSLLRSGVSSVTYDTVSELAAGSLEALLTEYAEQTEHGCIGVCPLERTDDPVFLSMEKPSCSRMCAVFTPEAAAALAAAISLPQNMKKREIAVTGLGDGCTSSGEEAAVLTADGISPVIHVNGDSYVIDCVSTDVSGGRPQHICCVMTADNVIGAIRAELNAAYRASPDEMLPCREVVYAAKKILAAEAAKGEISSFGKIEAKPSEDGENLILTVSFTPSCGSEKVNVAAEIYFM